MSKKTEKAKGLFEEFKTFIKRGNVLDLAVGVIIGGAFTAIVTSLVNDIINPLLSLITGKIDFTTLFISLDGTHYETLAEAEEAGAAILKYGSFISNLINFLIMAFCVFILVKIINKILTHKDKEEKKEEPAPVKSDEVLLLEEIRDALKKK